jgi:hypothetical protein
MNFLKYAGFWCRVIAVFFVAEFVWLWPVSVHGGGNTIEPVRSILVDSDTWHFNWASFDQDKIVSYGNYQYTIYWDADKVLVLVRRDLRNDAVQSIRFEGYTLSIDPNDGHRNTVIGISPGNGQLHLSWDHHNNDLRYTKTKKHFLTNPPEQISENDFEPAQALAPGALQQVTYPRFINDGKGRLYFMYRSGGSGDGRIVIARYDSGDAKWHVSSGILFGPEGKYKPWQNSDSRSAYLHDVLFDKNNRLHVTWIYRETHATWASNHDLHYAYSDDYGITWMNNGGKKIADLSKNDAIVIDDPGIVVQEIPVYAWVMNQCAMGLDSRNQPHVALYRLPDRYKPEKPGHGPPPNVRKRLRFFHYWRDTGGNWHSSGPLHMPEGLTIRRPDIVIDNEDNVIIYWSSNQGFHALVAQACDKWQTWQAFTMTEPDVSSTDVSKHDRRLLTKKGVLSFTADPKGLKDGSGYTILDFDLKDISVKNICR